MGHEQVTARVLLRRDREPRVLSGHLWIFEGEIDKVDGSPDVGDLVDLV